MGVVSVDSFSNNVRALAIRRRNNRQTDGYAHRLPEFCYSTSARESRLRIDPGPYRDGGGRESRALRNARIILKKIGPVEFHA